LRRVRGEDEEGRGDRDEDDDPAHRRRDRLLVVALRSLGTDVLTEFPLAQERDELGAEEDADEQRGGPRDQYASHQEAAPAPADSASTTTSRPTPREPFTSTVSPGESSSPTSAAA